MLGDEDQPRGDRGARSLPARRPGSVPHLPGSRPWGSVAICNAPPNARATIRSGWLKPVHIHSPLKFIAATYSRIDQCCLLPVSQRTEPMLEEEFMEYGQRRLRRSDGSTRVRCLRRDTKDSGANPVLAFAQVEWSGVLSGVKAGKCDEGVMSIIIPITALA